MIVTVTTSDLGRNCDLHALSTVACVSREAADPRQLLRSINAPEASLVEPAAGLHIRFRLGGSSFPPILLYKVFTHRPVTGVLVALPALLQQARTSGRPVKLLSVPEAALTCRHPNFSSCTVLLHEFQRLWPNSSSTSIRALPISLHTATLAKGQGA